MGWSFLLGVAVLALGSAATEYDNIPLETSSVGHSRKSSPRTIYTASYGIAPGEYVLRSSHHGHNTPSPIRGLGFLPKDQSPPQEYLDLLRQTGIEDGEIRGKQQSVKNKVIDQQYFGIQPSAPYIAPGIIPSQGLNYDQPSIISTTTFPPSRQNVIVNIATGPGYPAAVASPAPPPANTPKPEPPSGSRKVLPYSSSLSPSVTRQGAGKAVPLTYSLDYDLASLHKIGGSSGKNDGSSSNSGSYYKETPGTVVRGDKELLNQLAPTPSPLPFLPSYDESSDRQKSKNADSLEDDKDKIEVIKLPSPRGQRPITQAELLELIRAGYDVRPAEEHTSQRQSSNVQRPASGYQRVIPQNSLLLPTSGGATAPASSSGNIRTTKTQTTSQNFGGYQRVAPQNSLLLPTSGGATAPAGNLRTFKTQPISQNFSEQPGIAPSAGGVDAAYYRTSSPAPIPLIRQQHIDPQVQTYQPGASGIQSVEQHQQNYQNEADIQPQTYHTTENYVTQGFPSAPAQQQQDHQQLAGHQNFNFPTAAGQQQQEYQQINAEQGQILQHPIDPQVQVYQPTGFSQPQSEALSQPKEYIIPAPPRHKTYRTRVNQAYQSPSPSAPGSDGGVTYQQSLRPIPQGYTSIPTGAGVTGQGATGEGAASHGVTAHGEALPDDAFLGVSGPGLEIQRTQPRRRTSKRRQNSQRESHVTYVHRYQGENAGYPSEN